MALTMEQQTSHLSRLQQEVLQWDYFTMGDGQIDRSGGGDKKTKKLRDVPNTFSSVNEYLEVFQPLVLEECAAQIARGDEDVDLRENGASTIGAVFTAKRVDGFHVVQFILSEDAMGHFHDNDLILVSKTDPNEELELVDEKGKNAGTTSSKNGDIIDDPYGDPALLHNVHALGYVDGRDSRNMMRVRLFLPEPVSRVVGGGGGIATTTSKGSGKKRGSGDNKNSKSDSQKNKNSDDQYTRFRMVRNALSSPKSAWYLTHLANMSTIAREWLALRAFPSLPFAHAILGAQPESTNTDAKPVDDSAQVWELPPPLSKAMHAAYNDSQLRALNAALEKQPITLIQGPPGTGKTRIILSLLSVILHAQPGAHASRFGHEVDLKRFLEKREKQPRAKSNASEVKRNHVASSPWMRGAVNQRDLPPDPVWVMNGSYLSTSGFNNSTKPEVPEIVGESFKKRQKVLVCAPSNAALDEIVLRIMRSGLLGPDGKTYSPTLVRVGVNAHHSVEKVSMEYLVNERCGGEDDPAFGNSKSTSKKFEKALERDRVKCLLLDEAQVVCSTLSFSGSGMFSRMTRTFDVVVIDEAAQAVEPSTLVPLCYGAKQAFLVGDPKQLPATVLSSTATSKGYTRSLFKRFEECGYPVHLLKTQYRMHPDIREFPSTQFYNNELEDGPKLKQKTKRKWHGNKLFRPFVFYDVEGSEYRASNGASWANDEEARLVVSLVKSLVKNFPELLNQDNTSGGGVGVISPYKAQVKQIKQMLEKELGPKDARSIDVNSIDGFQGREKEVCVFSVVRAPRVGGSSKDTSVKGKKNVNLGFVADERRVNVGLTRAKTSLLVVGSAKALKTDGNWGGLVASAYNRDLVLRPAGKTQSQFDQFVAKHSVEYDSDDLSGDEKDVGGVGGDVDDDDETDETKKETKMDFGQGHVHKPEWHTTGKMLKNAIDTSRKSGFSLEPLVDDFVTEKLGTKGVGGSDDYAAPNEDDEDDAFIQHAEPAGKKNGGGKTAGTRGTKRQAAEKPEKAAAPAKQGRGRAAAKE